MPRAISEAGQESLRSGGPAGSGCHPPRPSAEVSVRLLSGGASTNAGEVLSFLSRCAVHCLFNEEIALLSPSRNFSFDGIRE